MNKSNEQEVINQKKEPPVKPNFDFEYSGP